MKQFIIIAFSILTHVAFSGEEGSAPPGSDNIAFGFWAGENSSGNNNNVVLLGTNAGRDSRGNSDCVFIGSNAGRGLTNQTGAVVIGDVFAYTNGIINIKGFPASEDNSISFIVNSDDTLGVYRYNNLIGSIPIVTPLVYVSFETGYGEYVESIEIIAGETINAPTNIHCYAPSYGGYDGGFAFDGWYYESDPTRKYQPTDTFYENTVLYAKWQNNCYINAEDVILHDLFYEQGKTYFQGIYVTDFKTGFMDYFHGTLDKDNFKVYCVYNNTTNAVPVTSIVYQAGEFEFNFEFGNISAPGNVEHWIQIDCMDESNKTRSESVYTSILPD